MNNKITLAVLSTALLLLSGCATMNEDECRSADWYSVGFEDGAHGRAINYIGNHREACAEYGISPEAGRYQDGWNEGIRRYCTPRNGYQAGMSGRSSAAQCPADMAREFAAAYRYGKQIYLLNRDISAIDHDMRAQQSELEKVQQELAQIEKQMMGASRRDREQDRMHLRLRQLYRQEADLQAQLAALDRANRRKKDEPEKGRDKEKERDKDKGRDKEKERDKDRDHDKEKQRDKDNGRDKERKKDNGHDNGNNRDNDKRKFAFAPNDRSNNKTRKQLEKELAAVRRAIRSLEGQLGRRERQQNNWELLQRSRQLSQREGQLTAQLEMLHRERMDLEREVDWLKRRAPY
jgi:cell division protein FtsB